MSNIEAHELHGKKVVDVNNGEQVGSVSDLLIDSIGRRVAGIVVSTGSALTGNDRDEVIPAEAIQAVGRDAITVDRATAEPARPSPERTDMMARSSAIGGRRIVTTSGREVGQIDDVLIDVETGELTGYRVSRGPLGAFANRDEDHVDYVTADPDVRLGEDVVVVPDAAVRTQANMRRDADDPEAPQQRGRGPGQRDES